MGALGTYPVYPIKFGGFLALESTACLAEAEAASLDNHGRKHLVLLPRKRPLGHFC